MHYVWVYLATLPFAFAIDMLWLGVVARGLYQEKLAHLLAPTINWPVAVAFYLIFIAAVIFFAVVPGVAAQSFVRAVLLGALLGFVAYATYDLTNWSTLKDWPMSVAVVDMLWGTVLSASVAGWGYWMTSLLAH